MIRQTSADAYRIIKEEGLLSEKRWQIYEILYAHGPLTANEIFQRQQGSTLIAQANTHARLNEMREMRCVMEVGKRPCTLTGMEDILWDVTRDLPVPLQPRTTKTDLITRLCEALEEMNEHLKTRKDLPFRWQSWLAQSEHLVEQSAKFRKKRKLQ